jgi:hypothetical protein
MGTTYLIAKPEKREQFYVGKGPFRRIFPDPTVLFVFPDQYGSQEAFTLKVESEFMDYFGDDNRAKLLEHARDFAIRLWTWAGHDSVSFMSEHDHDAWFDQYDERLEKTGSRWENEDDDC